MIRYNKKLIVRGVLICTFVLALFYYDMFSSVIRIGTSSFNNSEQWSYKFYFLHGEVHGSLVPSTDTSTLVIIKEIDRGSVDLNIKIESEKFFLDLPNYCSDTLKIKLRKGKMYRVTATAKKAKGSFSLKLWERNLKSVW